MHARPARRSIALRLFQSLLLKFGPQGWWPVLNNTGDCVYLKGNYSIPRTEHERVQVTVGALLAQNTSWSNAAAALKNIHQAGKLDLQSISSMRVSSLASLIRPSGYYNQKSARLKVFAKFVCKNYGCSLAEMFEGREVDALRSELLSLDGIGPETADSILLYAAKMPSFVIDAYTFRLNDEYGLHELSSKSHENRYNELKSYFESSLARSVPVYNEFHALIVEWGKQNRR